MNQQAKQVVKFCCNCFVNAGAAVVFTPPNEQAGYEQSVTRLLQQLALKHELKRNPETKPETG
jgi:hypothetical protein